MRRISRVLSYIVIVFLSVLLTCNLYVLAAKKLTGELQPTVFGWSSAVVLSGSMEPTIRVNDMVVFHAQEDYQAGDIIGFESGDMTVTHRIIEETKDGYRTQGDYNNTPDLEPVPEEAVIGRAVLIIPWIGSTAAFLRTPLGMLMLVLGGLVLWVWPNLADLMKRRNERREGNGNGKNE